MKVGLSRKWWWKILALLLLMYTFVMGFLGQVPALPIINETIRNLYFHVTMWMAMFLMMILNVIFGIRYLNSSNLKDDLIAEESARIAILLGTAGLITGMVWANFTWGAPWVNDPQLNGTAATMLLYAAYFLLRNAVIDPVKRAKLSSIYCIFAFVMMYVFIMVLPKMTDSLHPGKGGNPGFNKYDLDSNMRMVFYPAVIAWCLLSVWLMSLRVRLRLIEKQIANLS